MKTKEVIGTDVSKLTLDVILHESGKYRQFSNNRQGYQAMITWIKRQVQVPLDQVLISSIVPRIRSIGSIVNLPAGLSAEDLSKAEASAKAGRQSSIVNQ